MGLVRFIADRFSRSRKPFSPSEPGGNVAHELGRWGEQEAAHYLRRQGYKILYRNFRGRRGGEIDLVCRDRDTLAFVEVKTRSSVAFGDPGSAVNAAKQRLIVRGALAWLRLLHTPEILFRFDIVEVVSTPAGPEVNLIRNAFSLPENYVY